MSEPTAARNVFERTTRIPIEAADHDREGVGDRGPTERDGHRRDEVASEELLPELAEDRRR